MTYDSTNVFAKILRGEITCKKIYENDDVLAFYDINPKAKIHALVITKGTYTDFQDFMEHSSDKEISDFFRSILTVVNMLG